MTAVGQVQTNAPQQTAPWFDHPTSGKPRRSRSPGRWSRSGWGDGAKPGPSLIWQERRHDTEGRPPVHNFTSLGVVTCSRRAISWPGRITAAKEVQVAPVTPGKIIASYSSEVGCGTTTLEALGRLAGCNPCLPIQLWPGIERTNALYALADHTHDDESLTYASSDLNLSCSRTTRANCLVASMVCSPQ